MIKDSVIAGGFAGLLTVATYYGVYGINKASILSELLSWGTLVYYFLAMIIVNLLWKNRQGGVLEFKDALKSAFLVFLVANAIYYLFFFWIYNADTQLFDIQVELMKEKALTFPAGSDARKQLESLEGASPEVGAGYCVSRYFMGAIYGFILSLILAMLIKQK